MATSRKMRSRTIGPHWIRFAAVLCGSLATGVQDAGPQQRSDNATKSEARAIYESAVRHYNLGEYSEAAEAFKEAYRRTPTPELLYNIAQAYRLSGDCAKALGFYRS